MPFFLVFSVTLRKMFNSSCFLSPSFSFHSFSVASPTSSLSLAPLLSTNRDFFFNCVIELFIFSHGSHIQHVHLMQSFSFSDQHSLLVSFSFTKRCFQLLPGSSIVSSVSSSPPHCVLTPSLHQPLLCRLRFKLLLFGKLFP